MPAKKKKAAIVLKEMALADIAPAEYNPRLDLKPGDKQYKKLDSSLTKFGLVEPIVWNKRTKRLVGGHQRVKVLIGQGYTHTDVSVVDLPDKQERVLNAALNKIGGDWDYDKLPALIQSIEQDMREYTGFDADEIAVLVAGIGANIDTVLDTVPSDLAAMPDEIDKTAFVIYLSFENKDTANEWLESNDFKERIKKNSRTLMIRME